MKQPFLFVSAFLTAMLTLPLAADIPDWPSATIAKSEKICNGVDLHYFYFPDKFGGPQSISIVEIDLEDSGFTLNLDAVTDGKRLTVKDWLEKNPDAVLSVNCGFFDFGPPSAAVFGMRLNNAEWNAPVLAGDYGIIGLEKNGKITVKSAPSANWDNYVWARESRPLLVENEKICNLAHDSFNNNRHPRTAIGIDDDGEELYIVVVDGRHKEAIGLSCHDLARLMLELDCETAFNCDGGGSSTLAIRNSMGEIQVVNYPSDNKKFDHDGLRRVFDCITIVKDAK